MPGSGPICNFLVTYCIFSQIIRTKKYLLNFMPYYMNLAVTLLKGGAVSIKVKSKGYKRGYIGKKGEKGWF